MRWHNVRALTCALLLIVYRLDDQGWSSVFDQVSLTQAVQQPHSLLDSKRQTASFQILQTEPRFQQPLLSSSSAVQQRIPIPSSSSPCGSRVEGSDGPKP